MKALALALALVLLPVVAFAAPVDLSTFAPPNNPACQLFGTDPAFNSGNPWNGASGPMTVAKGDTITISMTVTNGTFTGPNILVINGTSFNYSVTLPIQVTASAAGRWEIDFATPGCVESSLIIITH